RRTAGCLDTSWDSVARNERAVVFIVDRIIFDARLSTLSCNARMVFANKTPAQSGRAFKRTQHLIDRTPSGVSDSLPIHVGRRTSYGYAGNRSGRLAEAPAAGRGARRDRDADHRLLLGWLGHRRYRKRDDAEELDGGGHIRAGADLRRQVPAQRRCGDEHDRAQEGQLVPAGRFHREGRLGDAAGQRQGRQRGRARVRGSAEQSEVTSAVHAGWSAAGVDRGETWRKE